MQANDPIEVTDPAATGYGRTGIILGAVDAPDHGYQWRVQLNDTRHPFPLAFRTRELTVLERCRHCAQLAIIAGTGLCPACDREDLVWHEMHTIA